MPDDAGEDTVTYQFEMPEADWRAWANTVPRDVPLDTRIKMLLDKDERAASQDDPDINPDTVDVFASRIRIRAMQAVGALRDDDDPEAALEELAEIQEIANALER